MYKMEKDNVIRYAPDEKSRDRLKEMGYAETGAAEKRTKRVTKNGAIKA